MLGWKDLSLQNSWSNYGGGYQTAQYAIDCTGRVWLRGLIVSGDVTDNTVIATLPAPCVPLTLQFNSVAFNDAVLGQLDIDTSGNIIFKLTGGVTTGMFAALNPISFTTD